MDVVIAEDDCLLVSLFSNEIHKYRISGEYVNKIILLPYNVKVRSMYKLKKKNLIAYSDGENKCISLCNSDGHVDKSIGKGELKDPYGFDVDEEKNIVYVADWQEDCVFMFDMDSDQMIKRIGSRGPSNGQFRSPRDVTVTNKGDLIVVDLGNHRLQLFNNQGRFINVLVGKGDEDGKVNCPYSVKTDDDNNMLVTSFHKLQLFNSDGHFIKRIDQTRDELKFPYGFSIDNNIRRVAVANNSGGNIKVFNY
ncbi:tripartite motif-containing protein 2-like [Anneissia japonica]|uniref:tripartite motif-containing protein 2-like n=1 Tax=Anneissia japonica TaxID=1529436 RepID=UPI0014258869|nr:tripartite motif-containing protein 2-like [Anneissia japonica]